MKTIWKPAMRLAAIWMLLVASSAFAESPLASYDIPSLPAPPNRHPKVNTPLPSQKKLGESSPQKLTQKKLTLTQNDVRDSNEATTTETTTTKSTGSLDQQLAWLEDKLKDQATASIFGTWTVIGTHGDGDLYTAELQLNDAGTAKLTIPNDEGQPITTRHKIAFDNQFLKLVGTQTDVQIGKVLEVNDRQMVVDGKNGIMTFVRR